MRTSGTVGNSLALVVLGRTRRLYNHCTPLLSSLAVGNLLGCVSSLPLISHNALTHQADWDTPLHTRDYHAAQVT